MNSKPILKSETSIVT